MNMQGLCMKTGRFGAVVSVPSDGSAYKDPEYLRNRSTLLAGEPLCAIGLAGCLGRATTVDHVLEVARGGDTSLANLRRACRRCNEKRGGRFGNAGARANGHHRSERPRGKLQRVARPPVDPLEQIPTKGRFT